IKRIKRITRTTRTTEVSDSPERFRKSERQRDTPAASDEEFKNAIWIGIGDTKAKLLTAREIKDKANTVSSWIENNKSRLNLSKKEEDAFIRYRRQIHTRFNEYKYFIIGKSRAIQSLRDISYEYL